MTVLSRWEQAKELTVVSPPSPHIFPFARAGASQRLPLGTLQAGSHPVQIRAEQQVSPTLLVCLRGGLGLRHPVVTSKKCHLPAPYHCSCSAGQEQQLTLCRYPMPRGEASSLQARMELDSVLAALPKSPHPHTLHGAVCVPPCAQAGAHGDRECCQLL